MNRRRATVTKQKVFGVICNVSIFDGHLKEIMKLAGTGVHRYTENAGTENANQMAGHGQAPTEKHSFP